MTSAQVPAPLGPGTLRSLDHLAALVQVVLGPETAEAIEVKRGQGEAEHHFHLGNAHNPYKAAA